MGSTCISTATLLITVIASLVDSCNGLGGYAYSPYYNGFGLGGHYGGYGYGSCGTCSAYPYSNVASYPFLKAKLLKRYLELKKPCLLPKLHKPLPCLPCLQKPLPCLPCLQKPLPCLTCLQKPYLTSLQRPFYPYLSYSKPASACLKTDTLLKYPSCGPCPYQSFEPKCLKHKATLALCS